MRYAIERDPDTGLPVRLVWLGPEPPKPPPKVVRVIETYGGKRYLKMDDGSVTVEE